MLTEHTHCDKLLRLEFSNIIVKIIFTKNYVIN